RYYGALLGQALASRKPFVLGFLGLVVASFALTPFLGRDFFPHVDSGQIMMHVRAPVGSRVEDTASQFDRIQRRIRQIIPSNELLSVADNIGLPVSSINTIYNNSGTIGPQDGDMLIALAKGHRPTEDYVRKLRQELPQSFPGTTFSFLPADITSQILNFGAPAPIDVQISGTKMENNAAHAEKLLRRLRTIPGLADARIQQPARAPQLNVDIDRSRIGQYGLTERDVTASLATSLAGTGTTEPVYYVNPDNGVSYSVVTQAPEYKVGSMSALEGIPISGRDGTPRQTLGGIARVSRSSTLPVVNQYDVQPVIDIFAAPSGRDLGAVSRDVQQAIDALAKEQPKGVTVTMRGQYQTMNAAFSGLGLGLLSAIVLIYLLIVVNFQSWLDPFVIITALPAALAGIVWTLFGTGTTLSVPALTGAIMCMGVATANSILVVSFARERLAELGDPTQAALEAGLVRFRPVLMTALAMIIGMLPMALGLGEGGEQNAPLGRAVIGGLVVATVATLFFVPAVFALVHRRRRCDQAPQELQLAHV
ncbi:MAG TPA: efflux RND transporter permease subunit, partial [Sphingomonas sp.]|nr:efflux RND transporter permease subunit [Sphingomonas sp.]